MKTIDYILAFIGLAAAEIICFGALKHAGVSTPIAVGASFGLCITLFVLVGFMFLSATKPYGRLKDRLDTRTNEYEPQVVASRIPRSDDATRQRKSTLTGGQRSANSLFGQNRSEVFRDELTRSLQEKKDRFTTLLVECHSELNRFDYSVLKRLEKNTPGSVEGVVTARKIYDAVEHRVKEIERFLSSQPIIDLEKGRTLLLGDIEVAEDNQLTSVFTAPPVPPIKISEVEFQMRVLLKRISRRRSIFRTDEMAEAEAAVEAAAAADPKNSDA